MRRRRLAIALGAVTTAGVAGIAALALVAPRTMCHLSDARQLKAKSDIKVVVHALEAFRAEHGVVPTSTEGLQPLVNPDPDAVDYLERVPVDPWGRAYHYVSDGREYSVTSLGADGTRGGEGNDADIDDDNAFDDAPN
jgi:general secretion pathway protein G